MDGSTFANSGTINIQFTEANDIGIFMENAISFQNSARMTIDIPKAETAQGILRYTDNQANDFNWVNTEKGQITISVSNEGTAAATGGGTLAGMDLRSDRVIQFRNADTLKVTVESAEPAYLSKVNWTSMQYFDT